MKGMKTGGRKPGSQNKTTRMIKECITEILTDYTNSTKFLQDFASLKPSERLIIAEKLMSYTVPKLQATSIDLNSERKITIEDKLIELSDTTKE